MLKRWARARGCGAGGRGARGGQGCSDRGSRVVKLGQELRELRVVGEDVCLGDRELPVEDGKELALDAANVALAKDTGA